MPAISKSVNILSIIDAFIIALAAMYTFISFIPHTILLYIALWFLVVTMLVLNLKGLYKIKTYRPKIFICYLKELLFLQLLQEFQFVLSILTF